MNKKSVQNGQLVDGKTKHTKKPRRKKFPYSDQQKAEALAVLDANNGNVKGTADELGIPHTTLEYWSNGGGIYEAVTNLRREKRDNLAGAMEDVAWLLAASIPEKIPFAPLKDASLSLEKTISGMQLLRGEPTSITGSKDLSHEQLYNRLFSIAERYSGEIAADVPPGSAGNLLLTGPAGDNESAGEVPG